MKKVFYIILTAIGMILSTTSCEKDKLIYDLGNNENSGLTGKLDLSAFEAIPNDDVIERDKKPATRAVDTRNFSVEIYKVNGDSETIENRWKYSEIPEIVILNVGDYKLKVVSHNVQPAEWETPYYYAEKAFTIEENKVTPIETIVCTLQNIKVTVSYTDDLKSFMGEDCQVVLSVGEGELTYSKNETRAGYFRADNESNQLIAVFTGNIEGREEVNRIQVDNVKAGEWRKITYDIKRVEPGSETGGITPSVTVKSVCEIIEVTGNVIVEEDIIVDPNPIDPGITPNPGDPNAPQITSNTIQLGTPITITEGMQVIVDITSGDANGLTGLSVDIVSPTLTPAELDGMGLSDHLDLVNPGVLKGAIEGLGFPTEDKVLNQKKVTFNISDFMPLLGLLGPGTHYFNITATDALGTAHQSLILVTQ